MRWATRQTRAIFTPPVDMRGFFLQRGALNERLDDWEWECPWCGFSVAFAAGDRAVAEFTARGHVLGRHGVRLWSDVMGALEALRDSQGADAESRGEE